MIRLGLLFFLLVLIVAFVVVVFAKTRIRSWLSANVRRNVTIARLLVTIRRVMGDPRFVEGVKPAVELVDSADVKRFDENDVRREKEYFANDTKQRDKRLSECLDEVETNSSDNALPYDKWWSRCVTVRTRTTTD